MKKKKTERQKAKEKAWNEFSRFIRTRDCLRFTGNKDEGKCVTCNRPYGFKQLSVGHFISGRNNAVLFNEQIVYTQCSGCNLNPPYGKGGNYVEYFVFMEKEYGREKIDEFRTLKHKNVKYTVEDFKEIRDKYKQKTLDLLR